MINFIRKSLWGENSFLLCDNYDRTESSGWTWLQGTSERVKRDQETHKKFTFTCPLHIRVMSCRTQWHRDMMNKNNGNKLKWYIVELSRGYLRTRLKIIINPAQHHDKTNTVTYKLLSSADFYRSAHLHIWREASKAMLKKPDTKSTAWNMDRRST